MLGLGLAVLQVLGAGHAAERGDRVPDLCGLVIVRRAARLELIGQMGGQSRAVGHFLGRELGVHPRDVQLLAQTRPGAAAACSMSESYRRLHIAELDDHRG